MLHVSAAGGRGLYFAADAAYSHVYATRGSTNREDLDEDESEVMYCELLLGDVIEIDRDQGGNSPERADGPLAALCRDLVAPPFQNTCPAEQCEDGCLRMTRPPPLDGGGPEVQPAFNEQLRTSMLMSLTHLILVSAALQHRPWLHADGQTGPKIRPMVQELQLPAWPCVDCL